MGRASVPEANTGLGGDTSRWTRLVDGLPTLTPKQTAFVNALLEGRTASDAYREAYNCENMSRGAVWVEASRLRANTKVALWLRHFQRIGMDAARITMESHLAELARTREFAIATARLALVCRQSTIVERPLAYMTIGSDF